MPRLSLKKLFLYLFLAVSGLLLMINIHQKLFPSLDMKEPGQKNSKVLNDSNIRRLIIKDGLKQTQKKIFHILLRNLLLQNRCL